MKNFIIKKNEKYLEMSLQLVTFATKISCNKQER